MRRSPGAQQRKTHHALLAHNFTSLTCRRVEGSACRPKPRALLPCTGTSEAGETERRLLPTATRHSRPVHGEGPAGRGGGNPHRWAAHASRAGGQGRGAAQLGCRRVRVFVSRVTRGSEGSWGRHRQKAKEDSPSSREPAWNVSGGPAGTPEGAGHNGEQLSQGSARQCASRRKA